MHTIQVQKARVATMYINQTSTYTILIVSSDLVFIIIHLPRFEFNMTDKVATAIFSYQCAGMEHSLSECRIGSSLCNVLNNNGGDIVAVSCHQVAISLPYSTLVSYVVHSLQ